MKPVFSYLLVALVVVSMAFMGTSPTIEASSASCGPVVQLPAGSSMAPTGDALLVTYPDGSQAAFDCGCSGSGSCSEVGTSSGVECKTSNCGNCTMSVTAVASAVASEM